MRRVWGMLVVLVGAAVVVLAVASRSSTVAQSRGPAPAAVEAEGPDPQVFLGARETAGQRLTRGEFLRAKAQAKRIATGDSAAWQFIGPTNIGGRIVDLAIDPTTTPSTLFAAVSSGGIMKSADKGVTWTQAYPTGFTQAMGALARGSDGTLYAGTGEANPSGGGATVMGGGLYPPTRGGPHLAPSRLPPTRALGPHP